MNDVLSTLLGIGLLFGIYYAFKFFVNVVNPDTHNPIVGPEMDELRKRFPANQPPRPIEELRKLASSEMSEEDLLYTAANGGVANRNKFKTSSAIARTEFRLRQIYEALKKGQQFGSMTTETAQLSPRLAKFDEVDPYQLLQMAKNCRTGHPLWPFIQTETFARQWAIDQYKTWQILRLREQVQTAQVQLAAELAEPETNHEP